MEVRSVISGTGLFVGMTGLGGPRKPCLSQTQRQPRIAGRGRNMLEVVCLFQMVRSLVLLRMDGAAAVR